MIPARIGAALATVRERKLIDKLVLSLADAPTALATIYESDTKVLIATDVLAGASLPSLELAHLLAARIGVGYTHPSLGQRPSLYCLATTGGLLPASTFRAYATLAQGLESSKNPPMLLIRSPAPVVSENYPYTPVLPDDATLELLLLAPRDLPEGNTQELLEQSLAHLPQKALPQVVTAGGRYEPDVVDRVVAAMNELSPERIAHRLERTRLFEARGGSASFPERYDALPRLLTPAERTLADYNNFLHALRNRRS